LIDGQRLTISQNFKRKQTLVLTLSLMSHSIGKKGVVSEHPNHSNVAATRSDQCSRNTWSLIILGLGVRSKNNVPLMLCHWTWVWNRLRYGMSKRKLQTNKEMTTWFNSKWPSFCRPKYRYQ